MRAGSLFLGVFVLLAAACSDLFPEPTSGPVDVLVWSWDRQKDAYRPVRAELTTLRNLRTLDGTAGKLVAGARLELDRGKLAATPPADAESLRTAVVARAGGPVDFAYFMVEGLVHPEDGRSLELATLYFNLERAKGFYDDLGVELFDTTVYYAPEFWVGRGSDFTEQFDNALFDPVTRTFSILPSKALVDLPPAMNLGVIAHEYAHAVFVNQVFPSDAGLTWLAQRGLQEPVKWARAANYTRSVDEGLADYLAGVLTTDPDFLAHTIPAAKADRTLTPTDERCFDDAMRLSAENDDPAAYDPYPLGAVLSAALWRAAGNVGERIVPFARSVVVNETKIGQRLLEKQENTELADLVDALASDLVGDLKPVACGLLLDRLRLTAAEVPSCAVNTPPSWKCPR